MSELIGKIISITVETDSVRLTVQREGLGESWIRLTGWNDKLAKADIGDTIRIDVSATATTPFCNPGDFLGVVKNVEVSA